MVRPGRAQILQTAKHLFMTHGYRAVSTKSIADELGVSQPAIYHHFRSKEALYIAVLEDELSLLREGLQRAAKFDAPPVERLRIMVEHIVERSEYDLSLMFHDLKFEVSETSRISVAAGFRDALVTPMSEILDSLVHDGAIAPLMERGITQREAAMFILGVIRTMTNDRGHSARPSRSVDVIVETSMRLVLSGLGVPGTSRFAES